MPDVEVIPPLPVNTSLEGGDITIKLKHPVTFNDILDNQALRFIARNNMGYQQATPWLDEDNKIGLRCYINDTQFETWGVIDRFDGNTKEITIHLNGSGDFTLEEVLDQSTMDDVYMFPSTLENDEQDDVLLVFKDLVTKQALADGILELKATNAGTPINYLYPRINENEQTLEIFDASGNTMYASDSLISYSYKSIVMHYVSSSGDWPSITYSQPKMLMWQSDSYMADALGENFKALINISGTDYDAYISQKGNNVLTKLQHHESIGLVEFEGSFNESTIFTNTRLAEASERVIPFTIVTDGNDTWFWHPLYAARKNDLYQRGHYILNVFTNELRIYNLTEERNAQEGDSSPLLLPEI